MTEYWLQKKTIGGWSHVTWYGDETEARTNLANIAMPNNGYSWRLIKAEVIEERLLEEIVEVAKPVVEARQNVWAGQAGFNKSPIVQDAPKSGWGDVAQGWGEKRTSIDPYLNMGLSVPDPQPQNAHGLAGYVWLIHHQRQDRIRVHSNEVDAMMKDGWERGGPRTQFRS